MQEMIFKPELKEAIRDYRYLLDKNYPPSATIKLVGDKYQLTGVERSILYRGVSPSLAALKKTQKKISLINKNCIFIDAYNVLFTLANYLLGRYLFIADDGFLRDTGELHGRLTNTKILDQTFELLTKFFRNYSKREFILYLDQPVSNSGKLSRRFNEFFSENNIKGSSSTIYSPDNQLINVQNGIICTSDSVIVQNCNVKVFDLSRKILSKNYNPVFYSVQSVLTS